MFELVPSNRRGCKPVQRDDVFSLKSIFDSFFNDSFFPGFVSEGNEIKADICENDKEYVIDAELPGVKKEEIKLDMGDDVLTLSVERKEQVNEERENYIRKERRYGSYARSFYVENIKKDDIIAKYNNGILTVTLPKSEQSSSKGRSIEIQ